MYISIFYHYDPINVILWLLSLIYWTGAEHAICLEQAQKPSGSGKQLPDRV